MDRISIVIPNWNGKSLLMKNLSRVIGACRGCEIILSDDGSSDGSVSWVRREFPEVTVIATKSQKGFASAVNRGVEAARGDVIVLLNTDVVPEKGFLAPILSHFSDNSVFAVGCLEKSHEHGHIIERGRGEATWKRGFLVHWRGDINATTTAWVSGGSGAFRKTIWMKLGGMDELYNPFYWEDIDLSYRAMKSGYRLVFEPDSVVHHYHESGKVQTEYPAAFVKKISYRNQFIFVWKNASDWGILTEHALWTPVRLCQSLFSGEYGMIGGYFEACTMLPGVVASRMKSSGLWKERDHSIFS